MIHYQLQCGSGHGFDGWFRDSATFDRQAADGEVPCPLCGDRAVTRAPMAPRIARRRPGPEPGAAGPAQAGAPAEQAGGVPVAAAPDRALMAAQAEVLAKLRALREAVESSAEHVGARFPEEARKIHYGEAEARPIFGDATPEEAEALTEEGVAFARIPWVPRFDG